MASNKGDRNVDMLSAYQKVFSTDEGELVLYDLMEYACFIKPCATEQDEGKRQVILRILEFLNRDMSELLAFIKQQEDARKEYLDELSTLD